MNAYQKDETLKKKLDDLAWTARTSGMIEAATLLYRAGLAVAGDLIMEKVKEREQNV